MRFHEGAEQLSRRFWYIFRRGVHVALFNQFSYRFSGYYVTFFGKTFDFFDLVAEDVFKLFVINLHIIGSFASDVSFLYAEVGHKVFFEYGSVVFGVLLGGFVDGLQEISRESRAGHDIFRRRQNQHVLVRFERQIYERVSFLETEIGPFFFKHEHDKIPVFVQCVFRKSQMAFGKRVSVKHYARNVRARIFEIYSEIEINLFFYLVERSVYIAVAALEYGYFVGIEYFRKTETLKNRAVFGFREYLIIINSVVV